MCLDLHFTLILLKQKIYLLEIQQEKHLHFTLILLKPKKMEK